MRNLKEFKQFINENHSDLTGTPITLIRNYKGEFEKEISGFVGDIGKYEDNYILGFWLVDIDNNKLAMVIYDEKFDKFIDGESTFDYTYEGKDLESKRIMKDIIENIRK